MHRQFSHRVKSVSHGKFTDAEVAALQEGGNDVARRTYLARWDPDHCPRPASQFDSRTDTAVSFIKQVFIQRAFFHGEGLQAGPAPVAVQTAARGAAPPALQMLPAAGGGGWESFDTTTPPGSTSSAAPSGGGLGIHGGGQPVSPNLLSAMTPGADVKAIHSLAQPAPAESVQGLQWESFTPQPNRAPPPGQIPRPEEDTKSAPVSSVQTAGGSAGWAAFSPEKEAPAAAAAASAGSPTFSAVTTEKTMAELPDLFSLEQPQAPGGVPHGHSPVPHPPHFWQDASAARPRAYSTSIHGAAAHPTPAVAAGAGPMTWQPQRAAPVQPQAVGAFTPQNVPYHNAAPHVQPAGAPPAQQFWTMPQQPAMPQGGLPGAQAPNAGAGEQGRARRFSAGNPFA